MANDTDNQYQAFFDKMVAELMKVSGAGDLLGLGNMGKQAQMTNAYAGTPHGSPVAPNSGVFQQPVGGQLAQSYAPSGVIFGGGSPFPVDPGPARLQNTLVGIRDLLNSPVGQQALASLKEKMGYKR